MPERVKAEYDASDDPETDTLMDDPLAILKRRLHAKLWLVIFGLNFYWILPPIRSFYKIFLCKKSVDVEEWTGDGYLYGLLNDVVRARRTSFRSSPGLTVKVVKEVLSCNETLARLMRQAFDLDMSTKKAADLLEVIIGVSYDERSRPEMLDWAIATFGPLVDAIYEGEDDESNSTPNPRKRMRSHSYDEEESDERQPKRTRTELLPQAPSRFDPCALLLVAPARPLQGLNVRSPQVKKSTTQLQRIYRHSAPSFTSPYDVAARHILQCLWAQHASGSLNLVPPPSNPSSSRALLTLGPSGTSESIASSSARPALMDVELNHPPDPTI